MKNKQSYYLDLVNYDWIKIDNTDDLIFEDDKFQIYSLDFGEWGGKTWFKEKSTGQEYVLEATTPLVNKIDSIELTWESFDITPNHNIRVGNSWNPNNYKLDTCRSYWVKEDSIFSNSIMYYGTKESNLVKVVSIDWEYERNLTVLGSEGHAKKMFDNNAKRTIIRQMPKSYDIWIFRLKDISLLKK